jgi:P-type Cu2+ transporter
MSCCAPGAEFVIDAGPSADEIRLASRNVGDHTMQTWLSVPGVHCGLCISAIERGLLKLEGVEEARVNLSAKRVSIRWRDCKQPHIVETLARLGYPAHLVNFDSDERDPVLGELVRALAIAGFAAGNIMLLSVSVWSGAEAATRDLFHWISALIAIPALAFAGRTFFRSAWNALSHSRTNVDVPISLGVLLAFSLSIYETAAHGEHAYFDASVTLLFFLLIGRTLDHVMREKARDAVKGLARLGARGAMVISEDGSRHFMPVEDIASGMTLLLSQGERVPVDAIVESGSSEIDTSLVTGESLPKPVGKGDRLVAGTLNLNGALVIKASAKARDSFLAEMIRLMEAAEGGRARYKRIADRASSLYAPIVHLAALLTFLGWMIATGDVHYSLTTAIAVLIITCPCALGLAVPIVQVMAARQLFEKGIMLKDGAALERLAEVDTILFDKTGTLTLGKPRLTNGRAIRPGHLAIAAQLASHSRHPISIAILTASGGFSAAPGFNTPAAELPGLGLEARVGKDIYRLGRPNWALNGSKHGGPHSDLDGTALTKNGAVLAEFNFEDCVRAGAVEAVAYARRVGLTTEIISGDHVHTVANVAGQCGIGRFTAGMLPTEKSDKVRQLTLQGHHVLMVGDGLNDVAAMAGAHVSMAPATAADIGRSQADFVFLHESLAALPAALLAAKRSGRLIRQNFTLAIGYNLIAVPIAVLGYVTPLVAAAAMSLSSIIVVANSTRLRSADAASPGEAAAGKVAPPLRLELAG